MMFALLIVTLEKQKTSNKLLQIIASDNLEKSAKVSISGRKQMNCDVSDY